MIMTHHPIRSGRVLGYRAVQVIGYVRSTIAERGRAPSYAEIMAGVGIGSKGEVSRIIASLEQRGLIRRVGRGRVRRIGL